MSTIEELQKLADEIRERASWPRPGNDGAELDWAARIYSIIDQMKSQEPKLCDSKELNDLLLTPDPSWDAWKQTIPEKYWARYDLSAAKLGWSAAKAQVPDWMVLWLWKNFVDGKPEYWAFDNPFPVHMDGGDPQTLGEPCGYAILKKSLNGRPDVTEAEVLRRIAIAAAKEEADEAKPAVGPEANA